MKTYCNPSATIDPFFLLKNTAPVPTHTLPTHLGVHNDIYEGLILPDFFWGHNLCFSCRGLIVVKETDKALLRWLLQYVLAHPRKKRIFCLILTPVGLRTLGCVCVCMYCVCMGVRAFQWSVFPSQCSFDMFMNILIMRIKKVALTKDAKIEQAETKKVILRWWSSGSQGGDPKCTHLASFSQVFSLILLTTCMYKYREGRPSRSTHMYSLHTPPCRSMEINTRVLSAHTSLQVNGDQHTCTLCTHLPAGRWSSSLQASVCSRPNPTALCRWHSGYGPGWMAAGWVCRESE